MMVANGKQQPSERVWIDRLTGEVIPVEQAIARAERQMTLSRRSQALLAAAGMDGPEARWYVLTIAQGADIPVDNALTNAGVDHWMPMLPLKQKRRSHRRFQTFCPLVVPAFPGYVFVRVAWCAEIWDGLRRVDGVVGVIGGPSGPAPLPRKEFDKFRLRAEEDPKFIAELSNALNPGDLVRIDDGPFIHFIATVVSVIDDTARVQVEVELLGRTVPIDLDLAQITKSD